MTRTPILFIIFNRPETARQVFSAIREQRPIKLYIAADGPRHDQVQDHERVNAARQIANNIDWPCEVKTLFQPKNLGCRVAVSSAISWFFENEPEGIILEDDCLPDPTFFRFCSELLERYRTDERIFAISGNNFQWGRTKNMLPSYYFSRYPLVWGWASWRRAWQDYDIDMRLWPAAREGNLLFDLSKKAEAVYWNKIFEETYRGGCNTWDWQWFFHCWIKNGLTIIPRVNLVKYIGFGPDATHTLIANKHHLPAPESMPYPLVHPLFLIRNAVEDNFTFNKRFFQPTPLHTNIIKKLSRIFRQQ